MTESIVSGRYVPAGPWAARKVWSQVQHLKGSFRPGERHEERLLFDPAGAGLDQAAARAVLLAALGPRVAFHRLILSPAPRQRLCEGALLQGWTRAVLADLGRALGQDLIWVAAVHTNTGHPHIHVLVAGVAPRSRPPAVGTRTSVELRRGHYALIAARADARAAQFTMA